MNVHSHRRVVSNPEYLQSWRPKFAPRLSPELSPRFFRVLFFRIEPLATWAARHRLFGFAQDVVSEVISLELRQLAQGFALLLSARKIVELAQRLNEGWHFPYWK
jgi:hypothetical protein